jgi:hypothetical protein
MKYPDYPTFKVRDPAYRGRVLIGSWHGGFAVFIAVNSSASANDVPGKSARH